MAEHPIDLRSSHRVEADGTHTVTVQISGLPTLEMAQKFSNWMRDIIRAHTHEIGRPAAAPEVQ